MVTQLKIRNANDGVFHLVEEHRKILKIEVVNTDNLETNFPGSTKEGFNYLKLEEIIKYYMEMDEHQTLTDAVDLIIKKGFFFPLKPGLRVEAERLVADKKA